MRVEKTSAVKLDGTLPAGAAQLDGFSGCHVGHMFVMKNDRAKWVLSPSPESR